MPLSRPSLHPPVVDSSHEAAVAAQRAALATKARAAPTRAATVNVPLTTISMGGNFDSYVDIAFVGQPSGSSTTLLVDSGNSMLIVPYMEDIEQIPNWQLTYTVLGQANEPWGCPANVVRGLIQIATSTGTPYTVNGCIFYACTGGAQRTANFGTGCLNPWSASGWNTPLAGVTMQAPLSYGTALLYAEVEYAAAASMFDPAGALLVASGSWLNLYDAWPSGYRTFKMIANLEWMSLIPQRLKIGSVTTDWPGSVSSPIAMVDTGGGPVFLSDPNDYVWGGSWPDTTTCPTWTSSSTNCNCISDAITLQLGDGHHSTTYKIDTSTLPPSVQGLTIVMCQLNKFMMGQQGMNIGGISALFNYILIDYADLKVGFKAR
jgi:hypothetical protein